MDLPVWIFIMRRVNVQNSRESALLCAQRYAKAHDLPIPTALAVSENGKPEPVGDAEHINAATRISVSHSGEIWACAAHNRTVGLDVQIARPHRFEAIARRFFCAAEIEYFTANPQRFYELWCAKEALVKYHGAGIARGFLKYCVSDGESLLASTGGVALNHFSLKENYHACLCASEGADFRLILENKNDS